MRRLSFFTLAACAVCAVAFSPGPEILTALTIIALAVSIDAVLWLKSTLSLTTDDRLNGHGHINLQADGLGAGGRQGPPRTIAVLVMVVWAAILHLCTSAGHALARTNTAAQPLPS